MLKGKREREASFDASSDKDSQAQPLRKKMNELQCEGNSAGGCLAVMLSLPQEILSTIFEIACFSRPSASSPTASLFSSPQSKYDHETTISLLTSSRCLYAQVTPIVFRHVKVTRPSSLALLYKAMLARPQLPKMITRLVIGPDDELPAGWWPLRVRDDPEDNNMSVGWIVNGFQGQEASKLPEWCSPGQRWTPDTFDSTCACQNYFQVLLRAQADEDIRTLGGGPATWTGEKIPSDTYIAKVFRMQAAMDLYLCRMRGVEDARAASGHPAPLEASDACSAGACGHYPQMLIREQPLPPEKGPPLV